MREMETEDFRKKMLLDSIDERKGKDGLGESNVLGVLHWHNLVLVAVAYEVVQMLSFPRHKNTSVQNTLRKYRSKKCKYSS